jgi:hypothetical protein
VVYELSATGEVPLASGVAVRTSKIVVGSLRGRRPTGVETRRAMDPDGARIAREIINNPDGFERIAWSIADKDLRERALRDIAKTIVLLDPDRAERLAKAQSDQFTCDQTLRELAKRVVTVNPDRAERMARSITDGELREWTLKDLRRMRSQ